MKGVGHSGSPGSKQDSAGEARPKGLFQLCDFATSLSEDKRLCALFPFDRGGFTHELLEQNGRACLVRRRRHGQPGHYEVVILHWEPEKHFPNGYVTAAHWSYPASEQWGERGWTYSHTGLAGAHRKYVEVAQKRGLSRFPSVKTLDRAQNAPRRCVPTVSRQRTDKETL
jgi:hypothetical protein